MTIARVTVTFPEWVAVTVYRIVAGKRCAFTEEVYWLEAYSTAGGKNSQVPTAMWIKRPKGQLAKCGKAASLRSAFPEECGYAAEEMDGKTLDDIVDATVIDGEATVWDGDADDRFPESPEHTSQVINLSQIHPKVQKAVAELVRRTKAAGAWKAAYDYAHQKFKGIDLTFALAELDKVSQVEPKATQALEQTENTGMPPLSAKDMAMNQARQTLGHAA